MIHRRKKRRRRAAPELAVKPSEDIEARVWAEIGKASRILADLNPGNLWESPYLVSANYYHDGLMDDFHDRPTADPAGRVVAHISAEMAPQAKGHFIELLENACAMGFSEMGDGALLNPVAWVEPTGRRRATHPFAIDLFAPEGSPVRSATRGVVVLAEAGWQEREWFSTSSVKGGNTVIVFNSDRRCFLRYAHLDDVAVRAGMFVEAGEQLGTVGHTGFNAARKGHGRHLHFEINAYDGRVVRATPHNQLEALLRAASAKSRGFGPSTNP